MQELITLTVVENPPIEVKADMPLSAIALRGDAYAAVLERHHLDFCCRGRRTLREACSLSGLDVNQVLLELDAESRSRAAARGASASSIDWEHAPLGQVIDHLETTHHAFTREAFRRIDPLLMKVAGVHGEHHPDLLTVECTFRDLVAELTPHLLREERVLFPYIRSLADPGRWVRPPFGTVANPVQMMLAEHDATAELLAQLETETAGFVAPADACTSYRALYAALAELHHDLHLHIALENNVLFPRAVALENERRKEVMGGAVAVAAAK